MSAAGERTESAADLGVIDTSPLINQDVHDGHSRGNTPDTEWPDDLLSPTRSSDSHSGSSIGGFTRRSPSISGLSDLSSLSSHSFNEEALSELDDDVGSEFELVHGGQQPLDGSWMDTLGESHSAPQMTEEDTPQASTLFEDGFNFSSTRLRFPDPESSRDTINTPDQDPSPSLSADCVVIPTVPSTTNVDLRSSLEGESGSNVAQTAETAKVTEESPELGEQSHATISVAAENEDGEPHIEVEDGAPDCATSCLTTRSVTAPSMNTNYSPSYIKDEKVECIYEEGEDNDTYISLSGPRSHAAGSITDTVDIVRKACFATLVLAGVVCLAVCSTQLPSAHPTPCVRSIHPATVFRSPTPRFDRPPIMSNRCNQTVSLTQHKSLPSILQTQRPVNVLAQRPVMEVSATVQSSTESKSYNAPISFVRLATTTAFVTQTSVLHFDLPASTPCYSMPMSTPSITLVDPPPTQTMIGHSTPDHLDRAWEHAVLAFDMAYKIIVADFGGFYDDHIAQNIHLFQDTSSLLNAYRQEWWEWAVKHEDQRGVDGASAASEDDDIMTKSYDRAHAYLLRTFQGARNVWIRPAAAAANVCRYTLWGPLRPSMCDASLYLKSNRRPRRHVPLLQNDDEESSHRFSRLGDQVTVRVKQGLGNVVKRPTAVVANSCRFFLRGITRPDWCDARKHLATSKSERDSMTTPQAEKESLSKLFYRHVAGCQEKQSPLLETPRQMEHDYLYRHRQQQHKRRSVSNPTDLWQTFGLA